MRILKRNLASPTVILLMAQTLSIIIAVVSAERAYPLGCSQQDRTYYDFENYPFPPPDFPIKTTDDYMLTRRLGSGKFSDVFEAVDVQLETKLLSPKGGGPATTIDPRTLVVLKCLKPVAERKIKRELLVLSHVSQLPNLARILGVVIPASYNHVDFKYRVQEMPSLVLEHAGCNSQWFCHSKDHFLPEYEIQYFLCHLLVALDHLHSKGIMHRDVKPRNVLIDRTNWTLMLIDLGLADFYLPDTKYNVRVASRHYKSPELLLGYELYDYALDLWGVGCILAGLLLRREPFFRGKDNLDQLGTIVAVLGTADLHLYMKRYKIPMTPEIREIIAKYTLQEGGTKKEWSSFVTTRPNNNDENNNGNKEQQVPIPMPSKSGLDLLSKLLVYDHQQRLTAKQAMKHPFFDPVRDRVEREVKEKMRSNRAKWIIGKEKS
ncbi:unnamed protein product [Cylindrotheca closterium]|uniref:non-specific serine/threonine protein kinase n=1 Tax=Cylindrotheca closterium TaxID=2856 RepID=A0AAD2CBG0_9STRA|nr:unnamed protein product [Cylindrotheca closterium]